MTATAPTDTVCACGHWYEEHGQDGCAGCDVGRAWVPCTGFVADPEETRARLAEASQ